VTVMMSLSMCYLPIWELKCPSRFPSTDERSPRTTVRGDLDFPAYVTRFCYSGFFMYCAQLSWRFVEYCCGVIFPPISS
jgi:hypothetical protein